MCNLQALTSLKDFRVTVNMGPPRTIRSSRQRDDRQMICHYHWSETAVRERDRYTEHCGVLYKVIVSLFSSPVSKYKQLRHMFYLGETFNPERIPMLRREAAHCVDEETLPLTNTIQIHL